MNRLARGVLAASVGTLAMDLLLYRRYARGGGEQSFRDWEFSKGLDSFDGAGAPAQVGKRIAKDVLGKDLPPESAALTNNVVHWMTGIQWGALFGIAKGRLRVVAVPRAGVALASVAFGASYAVLPKLDIYKPIWTYDKKTLVDDYSGHLVYGAVTSTTFWLLGLTSRKTA